MLNEENVFTLRIKHLNDIKTSTSSCTLMKCTERCTNSSFGLLQHSVLEIERLFRLFGETMLARVIHIRCGKKSK